MFDVKKERRMRGWLRRTRRKDHGPDTAELQRTFAEIYADGTWTDKLPGMPRSGRGALYEHSLSVVEFIESKVATGDVRSIVDIGCGDLTYMSQIPSVTDGTVTYVGYDIVPELVDEHRQLAWGDFRVGDVTATGFRVDADLVLCKDVLFHLTDEQIDRALRNLKASRWRHLLLTSSDNDTNDNRTFDRWHYAPINFSLPPYEFVPTRALERVDGGAFFVLQPEDVTWPR